MVSNDKGHNADRGSVQNIIPGLTQNGRGTGDQSDNQTFSNSDTGVYPHNGRKKFLNIWEKLGELENSDKIQEENVEQKVGTQNERAPFARNHQSYTTNNRYG
ncbi:hypothetical protein QTP88_006288 [Uroleucon formosanum]